MGWGLLEKMRHWEGHVCVCGGVLVCCVFTHVSLPWGAGPWQWVTWTSILGRHRGNGRGACEKTDTEDQVAQRSQSVGGRGPSVSETASGQSPQHLLVLFRQGLLKPWMS